MNSSWNMTSSQADMLLDGAFDFDIAPEVMNGHSEETMDVALVRDVLLASRVFEPDSRRGPPETSDMPGQFNFTVEVTSTDAHKKKFLYSHLLGRIYVDMNCDFSMLFNWDQTSAPPDMYVRGTTVFADAEQSQKRVERCVQHFHENPDVQKDIVKKNVLRSSREIGTQGVYYCGQVDIPDSWYSVLVHFRKTSPEPCTHAYKFTCKSSCVSGINRRAIAIIFTLEDSLGNVYGRQKVGAKVCACLRRDMHKDEEAEGAKHGKKRMSSNQTPQPKTKKVKMEARDNVPSMLMLPKIYVEANAMMSGMRTMIDMMTNGGNHNPEVVDKYATSIAELRKYLFSLEQEVATPQ